jgi:hypothetical protein
MSSDEIRKPVTVGQVLELPHTYFNGFAIALSNSDVSATLMLNGQPLTSMSMSFTTAKTLATMLTQQIEALESATGRSIMTTHEVGAKLDAAVKSMEEQ